MAVSILLKSLGAMILYGENYVLKIAIPDKYLTSNGGFNV